MINNTRFRYLLLIVTAILFASCSPAPNNQEATVVSWGGVYQKALFDNWVLPSAKNIDLTVSGQAYGGEYENITTMVKTGSVTWDLVQVETFYAATAYKQGLLEKFDPVIPPTDLVPLDQSAKKLLPYAYPTIGWSYVISWNELVLAKRAGNGVDAPSGWVDFWDLDKYPGKRALRNVPQGNIEAALFAAGLTASEIRQRLYTNKDFTVLDIAFKKLDELKGNIIWWKSGNQVQRELESGRATLVAAWNGRVWNAINTPLLENSMPTKYHVQYKNGILDYDWWIIPKGAKNKSGASKLVKEMYKNLDGAIKFSHVMGYGPPNSGWETRISSDSALVKYMPTTGENMGLQFKIDPVFWAEHHRYIADRWESWKAR
jgi:putative spermidine/putrescine transport system substrate-binding protein